MSFKQVVVLLLWRFLLIQSSLINDEICENQLKYFDHALMNREHWALYVFDTWAKPPSSIFRGNLVSPGGFTDCVRFRHHSENSDIGLFQAQHCMVDFSAKIETYDAKVVQKLNPLSGYDWTEVGAIARENNLNFRLGFCLPASCSSENVLKYVNIYLSQADLEGSLSNCQTNDSVQYEVLDIIAIIIFSGFGILLVASTSYEIFVIQRDRKLNHLLSSFSVYTAGWKLYDVAPNKSPNDIRCLHGIRALSILYIIFGHRYGIPLWHVISNRAALAEWSTKFHIGLYHTHQVPVDVFFMMGGLLVAWTMLKNLDSKSLNIWRLYLHRYLRYTPLLAAILLFLVTLMKHIVFAPMSYLEGGMWNMVPNCEKWWWTTLLHIQNYVNPNEICMSHTWYLSVDFQLFIISPFLMYPAWKYGYKFLWTLPTVALLSSIYIFVMSLVFNIYIVSKSAEAASFEFFIQWIYYPTHARMGPWLIGMTLGYILYQNRHKKVHLNSTLNAVMWIICLIIFAAITMGSQIMFLPPDVNETSLLANAFYLAFYRNGWVVATGWMVYACHNGTGGIIRWFLQLPQWQPIGRMGLSLYLLSFMFQHFIVMNSKQPIYFDEFELIHQFWGDIVASTFLATIGYLTFEMPFIKIEAYIYQKIQERMSTTTKV